MRLPMAATTALIVLSLSGCGHSGVAASLPEPFTQCHASPPDVVSTAAAAALIGLAGPTPVPPLSDRDGEVRYAVAHGDISSVGITSGGYDYRGFTRDAQGNLAAMRKTLPDPTRVRAYCAIWADWVLLQVENRLMISDRAALSAKGIVVNGARPNLTGVEVIVAHLASDTKSRLQGQYGPIIDTVIEGEN